MQRYCNSWGAGEREGGTYRVISHVGALAINLGGKGALGANRGGISLEGDCRVVLKLLVNKAAKYAAKTAKSIQSRQYLFDKGVRPFNKLYRNSLLSLDTSDPAQQWTTSASQGAMSDGLLWETALRGFTLCFKRSWNHPQCCESATHDISYIIRTYPPDFMCRIRPFLVMLKSVIENGAVLIAQRNLASGELFFPFMSLYLSLCRSRSHI